MTPAVLSLPCWLRLVPISMIAAISTKTPTNIKPCTQSKKCAIVCHLITSPAQILVAPYNKPADTPYCPLGVFAPPAAPRLPRLPFKPFHFIISRY